MADDDDCTYFSVLVKAQTHGVKIIHNIDTTSFGIISIWFYAHKDLHKAILIYIYK